MKGWSDRDTNPQLLGQKQHAKQLRHLPPSIPQEGTKPNSQMRTVFTPNTTWQNHLRDECLLARMGAIWGTCTTGESRHMAPLQQQWGGDTPACLHQAEDPQTAWLVAVSPSDQPCWISAHPCDSSMGNHNEPHNIQTSDCKVCTVSILKQTLASLSSSERQHTVF